MKPFWMNLKLVIKKYLCSLYEYFPGIEYYSKDVMLSEMSKYICLYNFNTNIFYSYIWNLN